MRRALALLLALFFGAALAIFVGERYWIVLDEGGRTYGTVTRVTGENHRCGYRGRSSFRWLTGRKRGRPCTWFRANVRYQLEGSYHIISVTAGRARGHDQPVELARYVRGSQVPVIYRRSSPDSALRDEPWDVWGVPLLTFLLMTGLLVAGFVRKPGS